MALAGPVRIITRGRLKVSFSELRDVLFDAGPALENAVDLDDPQTVERLAALLDRVEERLRGQS